MSAFYFFFCPLSEPMPQYQCLSTNASVPMLQIAASRMTCASVQIDLIAEAWRELGEVS